ncbi:hypothetical protein [Roseateles depolymerans]|uniref:Uncharacterized protein n=1 Tax=Roseateles depolymerans TaxID=76731 RepID=A0A0U3LLA5_9BURK|nr:hypothetical protein [Roseateles depolymerans]ALV05687.1 hypothetical protein RD2015_1196 [Roseateles depolymerans]REG13043.1 hypothetical protein DES44_4419 [Roseateles depolymerans]
MPPAPGPLGLDTNTPALDAGTLCLQQSKPPGPLCGVTGPAATAAPALDAQTRKLAAIAFGEASTANDPDEIGGIAWAVANRCRAWGGKTVDQLLTADPNYTYAVKDGNARYGQFMGATTAQIAADPGMKLAREWAENALASRGKDPSNGAYWWDGKDFKTNFKNHPKVKDGFRFGDPSHNIFGVKEPVNDETVTYWTAKKNGVLVNVKERGRYTAVWVSTAAHGSTIFWTHPQDYLTATGGKSYR